MLGKLMKHEFRATARLMVPLLGAVLALSVFSRIADSVITNYELYRIRNLLTTLFRILSVRVCDRLGRSDGKPV